MLCAYAAALFCAGGGLPLRVAGCVAPTAVLQMQRQQLAVNAARQDCSSLYAVVLCMPLVLCMLSGILEGPESPSSHAFVACSGRSGVCVCALYVCVTIDCKQPFQGLGFSGMKHQPAGRA